MLPGLQVLSVNALSTYRLGNMFLSLLKRLQIKAGADMQGFNCVLVYSTDRSKILFCERKKDPYKGLYNLVGGKIEPEENGLKAAYRELYEETGIRESDITLSHLMDFTYYKDSCCVEVYGGYLEQPVELREEAHPLVWLDCNEDFFDSGRFAGEGNIGHMVEYVKKYGL